MAAPANLVPCFYTTVKNVSGFGRAFSFLGPHGKFLDAGTEYTEFGDLVNKVQNTPGRNNSRRKLALERALAGYTRSDGVVVPAALHIKAGPAQIVYDAGSSAPKVVKSASGVFGVDDPCYGAGY